MQDRIISSSKPADLNRHQHQNSFAIYSGIVLVFFIRSIYILCRANLRSQFLKYLNFFILSPPCTFKNLPKFRSTFSSSTCQMLPESLSMVRLLAHYSNFYVLAQSCSIRKFKRNSLKLAFSTK